MKTQQENTPSLSVLLIKALKKRKRLLFKIILCYIWKLVHFKWNKCIEMNIFFCISDYLGVEILFNSKKKKVMDEGQNNYILALFLMHALLVILEKNALHNTENKKNQSIMVCYLLVCNTIWYTEMTDEYKLLTHLDIVFNCMYHYLSKVFKA